MFKPIPIGTENFKEIIDEEFYYIDKTLMIKDILDDRSKVSLYTRPRRFGKTLNLSMIKYYFEKSDENNSYLFEGLDISKCGEKYKNHMGKYPVISLSLKGLKRADFEQSLGAYKDLIVAEFGRHKYVLTCDKLETEEIELFNLIKSRGASNLDYYTALKLLSTCLHKFHGEKVIILIDEYDVPLETAYFKDFYDEMVDLIRTAFESALKTNDALKFGILTGCLRISRESIFTGLNNLCVNSIMSLNYSEYFGFTEPEVKTMAENYGIAERFDDIKTWYNGYIFGRTEIYNPWSILNFINQDKGGRNAPLIPYWINTSSNDIIRQLIVESNVSTKKIIEELLSGGSIIKTVYEDITYRNINVNIDHIWSFLMFTGYLKPIRLIQEKNLRMQVEMVIPNVEVLTIYKDNIIQWFQEEVTSKGILEIFKAVIAGDTQTFEDELNHWLLKSISYYDTQEAFYHAFLLGLLVGDGRYDVKSNRENGDGRTDIFVCEHQKRQLGIVIEIKITDNFEQLEESCNKALKQIDDRNYAAELIADGYKNIVKYGVAFYKKSCMVLRGEYSE